MIAGVARRTSCATSTTAFKKMEAWPWPLGLADYPYAATRRSRCWPPRAARARDNDSGGQFCIGIEDRLQSLRPSTSERRHWLRWRRVSREPARLLGSYHRASGSRLRPVPDRRGAAPARSSQNMLQDAPRRLLRRSSAPSAPVGLRPKKFRAARQRCPPTLPAKPKASASSCRSRRSTTSASCA